MSLRVVLYALLGLVGVVTCTWAQERGLSPGARALIASGSPEPVEITLATRVIDLMSEEHGRVTPQPANNSLVLRVPAAYVSGVSFDSANVYDRDPPGATVLTLLFWNRSFDPVNPDELADAATCQLASQRPCAPLGSDGGRMAGRRAGGEYPLVVQIFNRVSTEDGRRSQMRSRAGLIGAVYSSRPVPCEFHEDPDLNMLVGRIPAGQRRGVACNIGIHRWVDTRTGRSPELATFLRRETDGSPRFAVRCSAFVGPGEDMPGHSCEMFGYLGIWPLSIGVPSDRVREWDETFTRIQDFLTRHTVSRTD